MFKIDKFRLVVVALLAVLTVAVAACESEPEKVPDPLIVGHLNALTGSLSHARRLVFQLAEVLVTREMLTGILERISRLRLAPG